MKRLFKTVLILSIIAGAGFAASGPVVTYMKERGRVNYREEEVARGNVVAVVNSTGTVKPVLSVQVGAFVSGPIETLRADFKDEVGDNQVLAEIETRIYDANVARDEAILATRRAEVERAKALLEQAKRDLARAEALRAENKGFISDTEMDQHRFNSLSLAAQVDVAEASVKQAQGSLDNSRANLEYTKVRYVAPQDEVLRKFGIASNVGTVIDRKIEPGQTLAAQFQTPEMFAVAVGLREKVHIHASVDESDIGLIREAEAKGQPVRFTVDAYPDDLFEGTIFQTRMNSTTTQNVVTYPVVVSADNAALKLWPGMTANISFQVGKAEGVLKVPNAALRFYPQREQVRPEDRELLDGAAAPEKEGDQQADAELSADEKAEARRKRNRRHVWVLDGEHLRAVEVVTGLSDSKHTEVVSGDLKEGQKLVTGVQPRN